MRRTIVISLWLVTLLPFLTQAQAPKAWPTGELMQGLQKLQTAGSVLYVAAHPDDENTRLLSWLANEKHLRTGYLALTRGDGGQNLIGSEKSELLGMIRTQELLAARRTDGAQQFFTRAVDFGYSKNPEETLEKWGKDAVLSDVVWVIRKFQPDIIITRFPTTGEGGHGHHTASAILAVEAFDAAADPKRFPEQLQYVKPWKAKSLYWNSFVRWRNPNADVSGLLHLNIGEYNPLLGKSYGEISSESRSMHKSQGFGVLKRRGQIDEYFEFLKGDEAKKDVLENLDSRLVIKVGSEGFAGQVGSVVDNFDPLHPEKSVPGLLEAYRLSEQIKDPFWREIKREELKTLIAACAGLWLEALADRSYVIPGGRGHFTAEVMIQSPLSVELKKLTFPALDGDTTVNQTLTTDQLYSYKSDPILSSNLDYSNPYWLQQPSNGNLFNVQDQQLIGKAENDPALQAQFHVTIEGVDLTFDRPVVYKWRDPVDGERYRPVTVNPPMTINIEEPVYVFASDSPIVVRMTAKAFQDDMSGYLMVTKPKGWTIEPAFENIKLEKAGDEQSFSFKVTPPKADLGQSVMPLNIAATSGGSSYNQSITVIDYDHIPSQTLFTQAGTQLVRLDVQTKGQHIGYIEGAGDAIPTALQQLGYEVTVLDDEALAKSDLSSYDAIVTGIRAYNTNERLTIYYDKLMDYIKAGGNLVVQYNTRNFLSKVGNKIGPYPFTISRGRVTVEEAPITFTAPKHPLLNVPNKITEKDFEGWVQERGLYFADTWDEQYQTIFSANDPGEEPLKGSTLVADYGKGHFIYTGLSFFREIPAGVPGAYRLLANMVSLGK